MIYLQIVKENNNYFHVNSADFAIKMYERGSAEMGNLYQHRLFNHFDGLPSRRLFI